MRIGTVSRNIAASYAGNAWSALISLAFIPIYIRYLGIEAYGLIGLFGSLQVWFAVLDMGLGPTMSREMARFDAGRHTPQSIRDLLRTVETIYVITAVVIGVAIIGASSWIAGDWLKLQALSVGAVTRALVITGAIITFRWIGTLYRSALIGLQQQIWLNATAAGFATARAFGAVLVLRLVSRTVEAFFLFQLGLTVVESGVLAWHTWRSLPSSPAPATFRAGALKEVWRFAAGMAVMTALATLLTQVDKLLLSRLLPLTQFGYFAVAITAAGALLLLAAPVGLVAYPRFSHLVALQDQGSFAEQYHKFAQLMTIIVLPAAMFLCVFSREILFKWTRDSTTARISAPILSVWVVGTALNALIHVPVQAQLAYGWSRLIITVNTAAVLVVIPLVVALVPRFGAIAAAWIWVALNLAYLVIPIQVMHRRILRDEKARWYVVDVGVPALAACLACAFVASIHRFAMHASAAPSIWFLAGGALCIMSATALATPLGRGQLAAVLGAAKPASRAPR